MIKVYYAAHATADYPEGAVLVLDDDNERDRGLATTGYFVQLVTPEKANDPAESADRAR